MKRKTFRNTIAFTALSAAGIYLMNNNVNHYAVSKNLLKTETENYYKWKNLKIYYTKKGTLGSPIILIHDLNPAASSVEWEKLENILSKNHLVYSIDLIWCS